MHTYNYVVTWFHCKHYFVKLGTQLALDTLFVFENKLTKAYMLETWTLFCQSMRTSDPYKSRKGGSDPNQMHS